MPPLYSTGLPNPGRLEEVKKEAQSVLTLDNFEGARFESNKPLTNTFALLHHVSLAAGTPGAYEFGAHVGDESNVLSGRIDMAGRLNGRFNAQLTDAILLRMQAQVSPESERANNALNINVDYKGGDYSAGAYLAGGGLIGGSFFQSVTQNLALGAEWFVHTANRKARGGAAAARLTWGNKGEHVATGKVGTMYGGMCEAAYFRKVSEKVSLATELQYLHGQACIFGLGYEFRLRNAVFKGLVQSDTTCSATLEERISPGISLLLSGQLNHKKSDYKFGVGLTIGGA